MTHCSEQKAIIRTIVSDVYVCIPTESNMLDRSAKDHFCHRRTVPVIMVS